jgi:hypothetical protein
VEKAVSILRKYAGCEVPLVANFVDYLEGQVDPYGLPKNSSATLHNTKLETPSLLDLITLFMIIPVAILLPIILVLRKANKKKKKKF